jgi:hypothetical protein
LPKYKIFSKIAILKKHAKKRKNQQMPKKKAMWKTVEKEPGGLWAGEEAMDGRLGYGTSGPGRDRSVGAGVRYGFPLPGQPAANIFGE